MMKPNRGKTYGILVILLLVVSVVVFLLPTRKTPSFAAAYACTIIAFVIQFGLWHMAFLRQQSLKSKFLGLPLLVVGAIYLAAQLVVLAVFTAAPFLPLWSAVAACAVVLGAGAAGLIASEAGRAEVVRVEEHTRSKVYFVKELESTLTLLARDETEPELRSRLEALAQRVHYSDPMSAPSLEPLETQLLEGAAALKAGGGHRLEQIVALERLLDERNVKCKLLK